MKHADIFHVLVMAVMAVLVAGSCQKAWKPDAGTGEPETKALTFSLGAIGGTRATGIQVTDEEKVNRWLLFLFDEAGNRFMAPVEVSGSGSTVLTLPTGRTFTVCALANYASIPGVSTLSALSGTVSNLGDNALTSLVMYGSGTLKVDGDTDLYPVPVSRLVAKTGIRAITVDMADDFYAHETFTLKAVYVTNVYTRSTLAADPTPSGTRSLWYNTMGWHGTGSAPSSASLDALTGHTGINRVIANGSTDQTGEYFYFYPNKISDDTTSNLWSVRHTRLVIEASIGTGAAARACYYVVTLPASKRNNTYIATSVRITHPGAPDPEQPTPYAMEVTFSTATDGWTGPVTVNELS
jgi:hypothetical protein